MSPKSCFGAYDIRAKFGESFNVQIARRIGAAFARVVQPKTVVLGRDNRNSSLDLLNALSEGLRSQGVDVIDLGLTGTEEVYFATSFLEVDGGIEVTASHNPIDYNGMKFVLAGSRPLDRSNGLSEVEALVYSDEDFAVVSALGSLTQCDVCTDFVTSIFNFIELDSLKPLKILTNAGNGSAGHVIDEIERQFALENVPIEFVKILNEPDGSFPNGIPNPLLPQNRPLTAEAVREHGCDIGFAWDGDFDRCFMFDEKGDFIEGYYIVGLLAEVFLRQHPGQTIVYDPRLSWNTIEVVEELGGKAKQSLTGHAFIKNFMREQDAVYGGEMSAHHYFRDFYYCDSGMIPFLLLLELLSKKGQACSTLVADRMKAFPCSGEINFRVDSTAAMITRIEEKYAPLAESREDLDGLSLDFGTWRFNLRASNTEPLLRLNVESRGDEALMQQKTLELSSLIEGS